jgi:hypothetical protein
MVSAVTSAGDDDSVIVDGNKPAVI